MKKYTDIEVVPLAEVPSEIDSDRSYTVPLVLVVDDEPLVADTLAAVLASSGLAVVRAYDGDSALEIALQEVPNLLLSDIRMPGMTGIELAMAVATELPTCEVLLFSGHASTHDLAEAHAAGFNFPLMTKPMHPVELLKRVHRCLNWQSPEQLHTESSAGFNDFSTQLAS